MTPRNAVQESLRVASQGFHAPLKSSDAIKQEVRLRRFALASVFSILFVTVLALFYALGKIDRSTFSEASALVFSFILGFLLAFRTGVNLASSDPSLTGWQFAAAVSTMLFVVYRAPDTRLAFMAFFFVAVMFGMLRRDSRKIAGLGVIALLLFAGVSWRRYAVGGDVDALKLDILQCVVMLVVFPWILMLQGHLQRLKQGLTAVQVRLGDIEETARRDDLTGIYNRRAVVAAMHDAKQRADATGETFAVCVMDIDRFKRYNDEFDHLTGDHVLRTFARAVQTELRTTDFFGRYGGEEFVQIMPRTTLAGAVADAERLRLRIRSLQLPFASKQGPLTVSVGVAQYEPGEAVEQTFARADAALYRAKQLGRDRVAS